MIKLLSLFSGIGAFEAALRRGGYQFETVNYCEIDPYASKAYSQIHGISEDFNLHDVRTVNPLLMNNVNLVTFGFPCQDISVAGKQKGFEYDGERTRSGLFFEALRIIEFLQPEYAICENVKALTSKKFEKEFNTVLSSLAEVGYNNYWKVLNAKDYGIPQNRERIFIISIRKDIDTGTFTFPEKQPLELRVKDMLESEVDEKFYINSDRAKKLIEKITATPEIVGGGIENRIKTIGHLGTGGQKGWVFNANGISRCLAATDYKDPTKIVETRTMIEITEPVICRSVGRDPDNPSNREKGCNTEQTLELKKDGCSNTLTTVQKDNLVIEPQILKYERTEYAKSIRKEYENGELSERRCNMRSYTTRKDGISNTLTTVQKDNMVLEPVTIKRLGNLYDENAGGARAGNVYAPNGLAPALQTAQGGNRQSLMYEEYRIRKLTPRECFRLMGFTDTDFDKIKGISNTQLYKMAGNSIVVNVLEAIFKQLFKENYKE